MNFNINILLVILGLVIIGSGVGVVAVTNSQPESQIENVKYDFEQINVIEDEIKMRIVYTADSEFKYFEKEVEDDFESIRDISVIDTSVYGEKAIATVQFSGKESSSGNFINLEGAFFMGFSSEVTYETKNGSKTTKSHSITDDTIGISVEKMDNMQDLYDDAAVFKGKHGIYISAEDDIYQDSIDNNITVVYTDATRSSQKERVENIANADHIDIEVPFEVFLLPTSPRNVVGTAFTSDTYGMMWVETYRADSPTSIAVSHELVHLTQTYDVSDDMVWWIEGSAEYIGGKTAVNEGNVNSESIHDTVFEFGWYNHPARTTGSELTAGDEIADEYKNIQLSDPSTFTTNEGDYVRGARVAYLIDYEIRKQTNEEYSIIDLHEEMRGEEKIDYEKFEDLVTDYTGDQFSSELYDMIHSTERIDEDMLHEKLDEKDL